jgi:hypothetical protein
VRQQRKPSILQQHRKYLEWMQCCLFDFQDLSNGRNKVHRCFNAKPGVIMCGLIVDARTGRIMQEEAASIPLATTPAELVEGYYL